MGAGGSAAQTAGAGEEVSEAAAVSEVAEPGTPPELLVLLEDEDQGAGDTKVNRDWLLHAPPVYFWATRRERRCGVVPGAMSPRDASRPSLGKVSATKLGAPGRGRCCHRRAEARPREDAAAGAAGAAAQPSAAVLPGTLSACPWQRAGDEPDLAA
ncbi:hypothetical protein NDU88_008733 [Pleurodeles waltl]|uniref:Uncharacterized protein n=1 Tax=Pleurodeles waltl TaxID=8319 RepID=A0AAV7RVL9_PLEWA|nr:hypothetical protein NDU88_008733 [Pleurodeles waltl]